MYYTIGLPRAVAPPEGNSKDKAGKNMKRSRSKRRCGGVAGGSEDDDYEAQAGSCVKPNRNVKPKVGSDSKESPSSSSVSCVEVEVVAESPVTMTIASSSSSSSSSDDDAEGGYAGGETGLTSSSESSESD
jgi:hypothetical protein